MSDKAVDLTKKLIQFPTVTPKEEGIYSFLKSFLQEKGFQTDHLVFEDKDTPDVDNIYARYGKDGPNFCFAGHTDVVPVGNADEWTYSPFAAHIENGKLFGRGASDMKSGVAAFISAAEEFIKQNPDFQGSISLLLTNDEEGPAINGTKKVLEWLEAKGETIDTCIVGEPTNPNTLGEMMKVGRRGSLTGKLIVYGIQGHIAYPHLADNPCHKIVSILNHLASLTLDEGNEYFQPSSLQISTIDVNNTADNVIPSKAGAQFNIRFNNIHTGASLSQFLNEEIQKHFPNLKYDLDISVSGEAFMNADEKLKSLLSTAVKKVTNKEPEASTTGGTSDARFIAQYCPVIEFGIVGQTMHKVDEHVFIEDIVKLKEIYLEVLKGFFL